jgi:hypothetical protein
MIWEGLAGVGERWWDGRRILARWDIWRHHAGIRRRPLCIAGVTPI